MHAVVFILSAMLLAYEVVLMRMFSMAQWHHFASMIISLALVGFGLSGTILSMWREPLMRRYRVVFGAMAGLFLVSAPVCAWAALRIEFVPMLLIWQGQQWWRLAGVYGLLIVPFAAGALAIGLALAGARETGSRRPVGHVYAANLFGSGLGAVLGLAMCWLPMPVGMSEYKALEKTLAMAGAEIVSTRFHPLGRVDVVRCEALRVAPGLSLAYNGPMPAQAVLFVDGEGGSAINLAEPDDPAMAFLEWLPSAAPYQMGRPGNVLVIGAGGGTELQQARRFGVSIVTGLEVHPLVAALTGSEVADGRAFVRGSDATFDLIQISLLDSMSASMTGVGSANESWLYTTESMDELIGALTEAGTVCVTRWLKVPARDNIRMFATAVAALERRGVEEPGAHLVFLRGWSTGTLLVKRTAFRDDEVAALRAWADRAVLDVDWFPGVARSDVNRRNIMAEPVYYEAARAIVSMERESFYNRYSFDVRPVTDDRPYFFHHFRWSTAGEMARLWGRQWVPLMEWGYVVLVVTLVQATVCAAVLIGLPVFWGRRRRDGGAETGAGWPVLVYFGCLGLGFMFVEIALLQKCALFLGHPLTSATLVIATFLGFAGVGAAQVGRGTNDARWPAFVVAAVVLVYTALLASVFGWCHGWPLAWRAVFIVGLLAPLAVAMGMMFPLGLGRVTPLRLPWAWAVNGCCSVIGAALAAVLAMDFGSVAVLTCGAAMYAVAGCVYPRLRSRNVGSGGTSRCGGDGYGGSG